MLAIYCRTSKESNDSTIEQQEQKGVNFALSNKLQFKVYKDEGKSGFKIDDETNPFSRRPAFTSLVNDIKAGHITRVWVLEHSRLSRNQYASAFIFNVFEKHNVTLYENDKEMSLKDPQYQFMRQILDAVSQYERNLIVNRTTRGLYNAINNGKRAYYKLYGYKRIGRDDTRHTVWEPVQSEIEKIKFAYKTIIGGGSLRGLIGHLYPAKTRETHPKEMLCLLTKWRRILSHFEYTGYCLNTEGLDVLHKYHRFEIDSLDWLKEPNASTKYLVKSIPYPLELVSVEDWVTCAERLHLNKVARNSSLDKSSRRASKDLCTGLIRCGYCNSRYYSYVVKHHDKQYLYYKHIISISDSGCSQKPKTFAVFKIDEIYKVFYFYFYLVFDDTRRLIEESIREIKIQQATTKEQITSLEKQLVQSQKQIKKFNTALDDTDDVKVIQVLAGRIAHTEEGIVKDTEALASLKVELEVLNDKHSGTELQNVYYSVKDRITTFFEKMNVEQRRNELLRVIKKSVLFGDYLIIEASTKLFVFDVSYRKTYKFDSESYDKLMNDEVYLDNFLNLDTAQKFEATRFNGRTLANWDLDKKFNEEEMRTVIGDYFVSLGIAIDLKPISNVVSFLDIEEFMTFMITRKA